MMNLRITLHLKIAFGRQVTTDRQVTFDYFVTRLWHVFKEERKKEKEKYRQDKNTLNVCIQNF
jgi:hypothetical protein